MSVVHRVTNVEEARIAIVETEERLELLRRELTRVADEEVTTLLHT